MRKGASAAGLAGALLWAAGCSGPPLAYTSPAGTVDPRPVSAFGDLYQDMPPEPDGSPFDPSEGLGVQGFADRRIGSRVADFAVHKLVYTRSAGDLHFFYPAARAGPGPGMCRARIYAAHEETGRAPRGRWQGEVFAVAGSVAPLPRPWPEAYAVRLRSACAARRDMGLWYPAPSPAKAYEAARLADSAVAAARRRGALPFRLACRPYPPEVPMKSRCADDARAALASADPRAIVRVEECREGSQSSCLAVGLAQNPERGAAAEEDQWLLNIRYSDGPEPRITRVDVDDDHIIFD